MSVRWNTLDSIDLGPFVVERVGRRCDGSHNLVLYLHYIAVWCHLSLDFSDAPSARLSVNCNV